jgi:RNA polymerase sigma-54 factor
MALGQKLILKQGQSLVMTPQLQQAIKLLQMSHVELQEFVDAELERNPLLERVDGAGEAAAKAPEVAEPQGLDRDIGSTGSEPQTQDDGDERRGAPSSDQIVPTTQGLADSGWSSLRGSGGSFDGEGDDALSLVSRDDTLSDVLTRQLNLHLKNPADRAIGQYLIGMVNDAGYLVADMAQVTEALGCEMEDIEAVLGVLRTFEPTGVFAKDLGDCLKMQLRERDHLDPAMAILLDNLQLVAKRDYNQLRQLCKVDIEDIQDMVAELKSLNPKPGHAYGSEPVAPIVPDVSVRAAPDGNWIVELNSETLPRLLVNQQYMAKVERGGSKDADKTFLSDAQAQATWLVKSLDQRARTILKVSREIVRQQDAFLIHGIQHLKPITLKTVAELVELHESTVSRVTSSKYMATPRGVFELKFFFTNAIASSSGEGDGHSSESVRHRIRELVARETPTNVLSDDDLVDRLKAEGIEIARRTVAKYRESLNILSSVQRRREAKLKLI